MVISDAAPADSVKPPKAWPKEVVELYEPLREIGRGGFASVMLARRRSEQQEEKNLVAVKVVGSEKVTNSEVGYAHREIDILRELSHPNINRLIDFWEPPRSSHKCAAVMALSYAKGPTIKDLLEHRGALSLCFGRAVIAQIVDAIVYLHERAVIHRDIKPDNVIVSGALFTQDDIWGGPKSELEQPKSFWADIRKKWHVTVIDFGFARALSPGDMKKSQVAEIRDDHGNNEVLSKYDQVDRSISQKLKKRMSALGNKHYVAPEVINKVTKNVQDSTQNSTCSEMHITDTLSIFVADYSMLVDAYSLGGMVRYMLTGVSPEDIDIMENPVAMICMWFCNSISRLSSKKGKVRHIRELPVDLFSLIQGLTHPRVAKRTSVRAARHSPWIEFVLDYNFVPKQESEIEYLECVMMKNIDTSQ